MLPRLLVGRHQFDGVLEGFDRIGVTTKLGIRQTEMFPNRGIIGRKLGRFAQMFDRSGRLAGGPETKPELGLDQEIVRRETGGTLQGWDRFRDAVQVDVTVADCRHDVGVVGRKLTGAEDGAQTFGGIAGGGNFLSDTSAEEKAAELCAQADTHYKQAARESL